MAKKELFDIIRVNLERRKPNEKSFEPIYEEKKPRSRLNSLEDFIIGEEETKYKEREQDKKPAFDPSILDEEFGEEKDKPNVLSTVSRVDFVQLDQKPVKTQIKELKREYLNLLDALEDANKRIDSLEKGSSSRSVELHEVKKETIHLQEAIRLITNILPDGSALKKQLETTNWKISDVQKELLERIQFVVDRVKNVDVYVEKKMESVAGESKIYKKKLIQYEAEFSKLEDRYNAAVDHIQSIEQQLGDAQHQLQVMTAKVQELQKQQHSAPQTAQTHTFEPIHKRTFEEPIAEPVVEPVIEPELTFEPVIQPTIEPEPTFEPIVPIIEEPVQETPKFDRFDRFEKTTAEPAPVAAAPVDDDEEEPDGHILLEIDRYLDTLPDSHKLVIQMIGEYGVSRNQELRELMEKDPIGNREFFKGNKFSYQDMSATVKTLRDGGFLDAEKVKLGSRGGYNFTVYELTTLGKAIYKSITHKKPVVSEKKLITNQHASLEHGFLIKDCAQIFAEMGYTVFTERKDVSVKLPDGKRKDFDFIMEKDGNRSYIEVERGTHTDDDFFDALDKMYQITNEFFFIAPNEEKLFGKTKVQVFKWIKERLGGMDKAKGKLTVNFATFEKVKKKLPNPWETIKL